MKHILCILHGSLEDSLPEHVAGNQIELDVARPPTVDELLVRLNIDPENLQFALADGKYIEFDHWDEPVQSERIQFWPRISGG